MILELLEHCLTPCTWTARSLGFLTSSIQVRARYKRCKAAWLPHLHRTQAAILEAAERAPGRRKALLFGAGMLHDIPLRGLAARFEEVVLADIVHSIPTRIAALRFSNVRLLTMDVTGVMHKLPHLRKNPGASLPSCRPGAFLGDDRLDLTVSVNLLSQLGWVPGRYLEGVWPEAEVGAFQTELVLAHLDYLRRLPGHTALLTDVEWTERPRGGGAVERSWNVLQGVHLPEPDWRWDWEIAPAPERERGRDYAACVQGYADWKKKWRQEAGPGNGGREGLTRNKGH